ncbi:hypothetical protein [Pyxidicoccus sp. MSG2]|uniref:hypothetical protein n=1 Tax=Pyxidicoccus sp. MSG2 TaxID=2996790 RepID=UPI0022714592|nr:hypothetical protein [Pyxidicoccus sp. MSG2]MCY1023433.1 hypothetical protein [Pyxidicoccus sp. MSG2]
MAVMLAAGAFLPARAQVPPADAGIESAPAPTSPQDPETPPGEDSAPDPELSKSFEEMRARLLQGPPQQGFSVIKSSGLNGGCKSATAYNRSSVERVHSELWKEVFDKLKDPAAAPLRDLLLKMFPPLPKAKTTECFQATRVYDRVEAQALWKKLVEFLGFAATASKPMTVTVTTSPPQATAQVYPTANNNLPAPKWTECSFGQLYRGVYRVKVGKDGYKSFDAELGVLAADAVTIHCILAASGAAEASRCAVRD